MKFNYQKKKLGHVKEPKREIKNLLNGVNDSVEIKDDESMNMRAG